jgi:hypothetical protein
LQKARLARIQIAKATSGAAFVAKKRAAEARIAAQEAGLQVEEDTNENIFELQHHHLLRCLEKTTVSFLCRTLFLKMSFEGSFIFYVPVAYIPVLYLRNPLVYSNSPSIFGCFTDSVRFLDFSLRDVIFSRMLYFHNIPLFFIISRSI